MKWGSNTWVGGSLVAIAIGVAIFAPWIALTDPVMDANLMNAELPPSWEFPFGTDAQRHRRQDEIAQAAVAVAEARQPAQRQGEEVHQHQAEPELAERQA